MRDKHATSANTPPSAIHLRGKGGGIRWLQPLTAADRRAATGELGYLVLGRATQGRHPRV